MQTNGFSWTQGANLATFAAAIVMGLKLLGHDVSTEDVTTVVSAIVILAGPIVSWWGRMHAQGPTTLAGFRI